MTLEKPRSAEIEALALARRTGWPDDLRVLIARYPREQWDAHANLGDMARFWLSRHAMFRELSVAIEDIATQFRGGEIGAEMFARRFVPRRSTTRKGQPTATERRSRQAADDEFAWRPPVFLLWSVCTRVFATHPD